MIWCAVVLVCTCSAAAVVAADPPKGSPLTLRALSYNVHHAEGTDGRLDLDRIAAVITAQKPDLVAVQEVDRNTTRSGRVDQAAELGKRTGLHAAFAKAIDYQGGEYGQVVLSRFPVRSVKTHTLPGKPGQETRIVVEATIDLPGGQPLTFLATHFQHDDDATRREQAAKVNELFAASDRPTVLAGDLNATPDSEPMKRLAKSWAFATPPDKGLLTIPAGEPRRQIDYVLVRPADRFRVVEAKVIEEKVASDHRPVLAVVELLAGRAE